MRDIWYGDGRDLIKWGVLLRLARAYRAGAVLQVAYYRPSEFGRLMIDGQEHDIPREVIGHFRDLSAIRSIASEVRVTVFDDPFEDRATYQKALLGFLAALPQERRIVFLDPDTGLEPSTSTPTLKHVLRSEVRAVWDAMKVGDVLAVYQHQTNRSGQAWTDPKRAQLAEALNLPKNMVKVGSGPAIARDVVLFYAQRA